MDTTLCGGHRDSLGHRAAIAGSTKECFPGNQLLIVCAITPRLAGLSASLSRGDLKTLMCNLQLRSPTRESSRR